MGNRPAPTTQRATSDGGSFLCRRAECIERPLEESMMADDAVPSVTVPRADEVSSRILPLSKLDDYEVADGYPEVRGWDVRDADDRSVGYVYDLLVDVDAMRVRFLDIELAPRLVTGDADRRALIPIENVDLDGTGDVVLLPNVRGAAVRDLVPYARRGVSPTARAALVDARVEQSAPVESRL
jgi:photosynthetic reaction center H subunit